MSYISMKDLLQAGVHFGHQKRYWNPQMASYIFDVRNKLHIIDLQKTLPMLHESLNFVAKIAAEGGVVLFVGTKKAAGAIIQEQAQRCGMPFVSHRWLGGMLTNFKTIKQSINRLKELESARANGEFNKLTKKEGLMRVRELEKLNLTLGGIKDMQGMPDAIFVVDVRFERIAIREAKSLANAIPVVGIVDTNSTTNGIDYVIPGNDDAFRSIRLFATAMADAVIDGKQQGMGGFAEFEAVSEQELAEVPLQTVITEENSASFVSTQTETELPQPSVSPALESAVESTQADQPEPINEALDEPVDEPLKD